MKKLAYAVAAIATFFVFIAIIVPLVVDVDKYRPEIVKLANEQINGEVEIGKLTLSAWGRLLVKIDGLKVRDMQKNEVISVQDAHLHIPFTAIFGSQITFRMLQPKVNVVSDKQGDLNVMKLMKEETAGTKTSPQAPPSSSGTQANEKPAPQKADKSDPEDKSQVAAPTSTPAEKEEVAIPGFVANAALGIALVDAELSYKDLKDGTVSQNKVTFRLDNLSLSKTSTLEILADLDTRMAKVFSVKGQVVIQGKMTPQLKESRFDSVDAELKLSMDDLDISIPGVFHKDKSVPANLSFKAFASEQKAAIKDVLLVFHNAKISADAQVDQVSSENPVIAFSMKAQPIDLSSWQKLIPPLKDFALSGMVELDAMAKGPSEKLEYGANLRLKSLSAAAPMLKGKPDMSGEVVVKTNQVEKIDVRLKAPGTDFSIRGSVKNFNAPHIALALVSDSGMDLDQLIEFPPLEEKKTTSYQLPSLVETAYAAKDKTAPPVEEDLDQLVADLHKNPMLMATSAAITVKMKSLAMRGVKATAIAAELTLAKLNAVLKSFSLNVFDGSVNAGMGINLSSAKPSYDFRAQIKGLELQKAVESQYKFFKNTLLGRASASVSGNGRSFNADQAMKNLDMKGNFAVDDGRFATVDINKMMAGGMKKANEAIDKASSKIKFLQGLELKPKDVTGKYEVIKSDFTMKNGVFTAPNFLAKAEAQKGIDINGYTQANLINEKIDARWEVHDTYNLSKADQLQVNVAGNKSPVVVKKGSHFWFPIRVGGTMSQPDYDYKELPEHFAKIIAANATGAGKAAVVSKALEKAPAPVKKALEKPKAQKALKKLLKF